MDGRAVFGSALQLTLARREDRLLLGQAFDLLTLPRDDDREVESRDEDEDGENQEKHGRRIEDAEPVRDHVQEVTPQREAEQRDRAQDPDERILLGELAA